MIYELRVYRAMPGKLPALQARFRDHTCALFEKHGMTNVGYWTNTIGGRNNELWYVLAYDDLADREATWASFLGDADWQRIKADTERDGPLVEHIENRILSPTDFSPLR